MNEPKDQSTDLGPPAVWRQWPAVLERAARARKKAQARKKTRTRIPPTPDRTLHHGPEGDWLEPFSRALTYWGTRIQREPARMFGWGAALAFTFGVLIGLL